MLSIICKCVVIYLHLTEQYKHFIKFYKFNKYVAAQIHSERKSQLSNCVYGCVHSTRMSQAILYFEVTAFLKAR